MQLLSIDLGTDLVPALGQEPERRSMAFMARGLLQGDDHQVSCHVIKLEGRVRGALDFLGSNAQVSRGRAPRRWRLRCKS